MDKVVAAACPGLPENASAVRQKPELVHANREGGQWCRQDVTVKAGQGYRERGGGGGRADTVHPKPNQNPRFTAVEPQMECRKRAGSRPPASQGQ